MSATTRCQRTIGQRERADEADARRAARARAPPVALRAPMPMRAIVPRAPRRQPGCRQRRTTRSTWPCVDLGEERQRERARGDVLADRELALAMAEALAVEAT